MSLKGRVTFAVAGTHPLLNLVRDYFIQKGLALIPWDQDPTFCLIGAGIKKGDKLPLAQLELQLMQAKDKPVMLLSSSDVYGALTRALEVNHADSGLYIPSVKDAASSRAIYAVTAEHAFLSRGPTLVVRPFNLYGESISFGVVYEFLRRARQKEPLIIHGSGYQTRTFLHEDDFFSAIQILVKHLLKGKTGVFNVGSHEWISVKRLADSIWQLTHGPTVDILCEKRPALFPYLQWKCPETQPLRALGWKPKIASLRSGLFEMVNK